MKIKCDVCDKEEASMLCCEDEAALCDGCDEHVHHANKLASKHLRFSLVQPSSFKQSFPLCDICQERRAFLFCQEDRAILCRECDVPIHTANQHTQKHNRFLLTGVKLSHAFTSSSSQTLTNNNSSIKNHSIRSTRHCTTTLVLSDDNMTSSPSIDQSPLTSSTTYKLDDYGSYSTSSISDYLMETLPGWHVEDFFDPSDAF